MISKTTDNRSIRLPAILFAGAAMIISAFAIEAVSAPAYAGQSHAERYAEDGAISDREAKRLVGHFLRQRGFQYPSTGYYAAWIGNPERTGSYWQIPVRLRNGGEYIRTFVWVHSRSGLLSENLPTQPESKIAEGPAEPNEG